MTKTRKRMLLSSIAMLLVALVALGSATYAWFSVSKTVQAQNMTVKAIAAAGLEISKTSASDGFGTVADFEQDADSNYDIKPVTWDAGSSNGYIPDGNVGSPGGAFTGTYKDTGLAPGTTTGKNAYFATYVVWVRSAAATDTHTVEAKVTATGANANFVRARLIDDGTPANTRNYADTASLTSGAFAATNGSGSTNVTASGYGTSKSGSTTNTGYDVSGTQLDQAARKFTLVVWFDGMDGDCIDSAKDGIATLNIAFTATDM